jgi:DNA-binding NarL/FixJ family response regulator
VTGRDTGPSGAGNRDEPPVRVMIADDSGLFAAALEVVLTGEAGIEVVGSAADGEEALRLAGELRPRVVLMDISMPVLDGFEATERIRAELPEVSVLMVTGSAADADVRRAREAGAAGYVTKDRIAEELVRSIRDVAASC